MRILLLALLVSFPLASRAETGRISPESFVGQYELTQARYGLLCEQHLQGLLSHSLDHNDNSYVQIDLGPWPFPGVNNGKQKYEDSSAVTESESYTTANSMVFESREVSKVDGEKSYTKTVATLKGKRLVITSESKFAHPGGTHGETYDECVYKKVSDSNY